MQDTGSKGKMTLADKTTIIDLAKSGNKPTAISRAMNGKYSNTTIRVFLNKNNIDTSKNKVDRSRPCSICGNTFTPKSYDNIKKDKYTLCSKICRGISVKNKKRLAKYNNNQISEVIRLKNDFFTNQDIVNITGVNLNTVKSIIKEEGLQLKPKQSNKKKLLVDKGAIGDISMTESQLAKNTELS